MSWPNNPRPAKSLLTLRDEDNALFPHRSTASDGMLGDAAHQTRDSDHNPWVKDGSVGVVTAVDLTEDAEGGLSEIVDFILAVIIANRDPRVKYLIHEGMICRSYPKPGIPAWTWAPYTGLNGHFKHGHISVQPEKALYDSTKPWGLKAAYGARERPTTRVDRARAQLLQGRRLLLEARDISTSPARDAKLTAGVHGIKVVVDDLPEH